MVAEAAGWPDTMRQIRGSIDWWMAELEPHGMIDWYKPESTKTPFSLFVDMYQHGYMDRIDKEGGRVEYQLTPQGFKCGNCRYTLHQIYA